MFFEISKMKYKINARRYDALGNPTSVTHSTTVDTERTPYIEANSEKEIVDIFLRTLDTPTEDGSRIRIDDIERLIDKTD